MRFLVGLFLSSVLFGCSGGIKGEQKTYPVTGVVVYGDKPIEGATVSFWAPKASRAGSGITNAKGEFSLSTAEGVNKITVTKAPAVIGGSKPVAKNAQELAERVQEQAMARAEAAKQEAAKKKPSIPPKPPIPLKYTTLKDTPLQETVNSKGENKFDKLKLLD